MTTLLVVTAILAYVTGTALALVVLGRATRRAAEPLPDETPGDARQPRIGDVWMACPACGWIGGVYECAPDVDGDGALGCPLCEAEVVRPVPPRPCPWPGMHDPYEPGRGRGMEWDDAEWDDVDAREILPPSAFAGAGDRGTRRALAAANAQARRARGRVRVWGD